MDEKQKEQLELEKIKNALKTQREYKYEMLLGRGSFGRVVKAKHPQDGQYYAVKILPIVNGETTKYQERELKLLVEGDLWKRNIVKYYGCWTVTIENELFLCIQMELCRVSLEAFVYSNDMGNAKIIQAQSQPRFYQQVFPQILNGLDAMHSIGWVHRDIHISNILIANPKPSHINEISIKIADFGLARKIGPIIDASTSLTDAPKLEKLSFGIGNELFRAPELSTSDYDYKVDLYSAGIVLYFLSRYLENKKLWKEEFLELRNGNRGKNNLYHQDDEKLFHLFSRLLKTDPEVRPTAAEALNIHLETMSMEPQKPTETTDSGKSEMDTFLFNKKKDSDELKNKQSPKLAGEVEAKKFLFKKDGDDALTRCMINDDTLSSLKAGIEDGSGVEAGSQVLHQKTTIEGIEELIRITSDLDVRCMFQSAEKGGKRVVVIMTEVETVSEMDKNEVNPEA